MRLLVPITVVLTVIMPDAIDNGAAIDQPASMRLHSSRAIPPWLRKWQTYRADFLNQSPMEIKKAGDAITRFCRQARIRTIDDITRDKAEAWLMREVRRLEKLGRVGARKTAYNQCSRIRMFAQWLADKKALPASPLAGLRMPRPQKRKGASAFTAAEVTRLIEAAEHCEATKWQARQFGPMRSTFYGVLAMTGLRYSEAKSQEWKDIDLKAGTMIVTADKARRQDMLPLTRECVAALKTWRKWSRGANVFPSVPSHHTLKADMERAGIAGKSGGKAGEWHRFRKCAVTERRRAGAPIALLTKLARHANPAMTIDRYDDADMTELRAAAELMPQLNGFLKKTVDKGGKGPFTDPATHQMKTTATTSSRPPAASALVESLLPTHAAWGHGDQLNASARSNLSMEPGGFEPLAPEDLGELALILRRFGAWMLGGTHGRPQGFGA